MSLPDAPNTLREKYYSVMAGQNDADILPDIETAPSTENRYLDYIARNGGGGGGDVTKAYVDEQDAKKTDKVTSAISGNFAGLDANGNLTDSGKTATDFATAADVTGEDISAISTTSPFTDSADGYVQGVTVKGKSRKTKNLLEITATTTTKDGITFTVNNDGTIKVTGTATALTYLEINNLYDDGLIDNVTYILNGCPTGGDTGGFKYRLDFGLNAFSDYGEGVEFTTTDYTSSAHNVRIVIFNGYACPSGGLIFKPMICTAADYAADPTFEPYFSGIKSIGDAGWGVVDLGTLTWNYTSGTSLAFFYAEIPNYSYPTTIEATEQIAPLICSKYSTESQKNRKNKTIYGNNSATNKISISDTTYTDATTFKSAMNGVLLYYPLADTTGATPTLGITSKDGAGQGTAATITTGLPLRSVSDSTYDTLDNEKVIKKCGKVKVSDITWSYGTNQQRFYGIIGDAKFPANSASLANILCAPYSTIPFDTLANDTSLDMVVGGVKSGNDAYISVRDKRYSTVSDFVAAVADVEFLYELATPTETPLTSAEKSALASLRTYDHTTHIDATDAPTMTVDYLLNTENGKAVADIQRDLQGQINGLAIKTLTYTGTGTATNNITFTEKPTLVLSIQITNKDPLNAACMPFRYGSPSMFCTYTDSQAPSTWRGTYTSRLTYSADELTMTITGTDKGSAWNDETTNYTLYYM